MTRNKTQLTKICTAVTAALTVVACTGANAQQNRTAPSITIQKAPQTAAAQAVRDDQTIDHLVPARDSVGKAPTTFSWTAAKGAEEYSIGIWDEVDRMVWRRDHITGTSTSRPADVELEPGTYFWTIAALRNGHQIADSGLAAFVVRSQEP